MAKPKVHMIVDSFGSIACRRSIFMNGLWTVTADFDDVTCKRCKIGWLDYVVDMLEINIEAEKRQRETLEDQVRQLAEDLARVTEENERYRQNTYGTILP